VGRCAPLPFTGSLCIAGLQVESQLSGSFGGFGSDATKTAPTARSTAPTARFLVRKNATPATKDTAAAT